MPSLFCFASIIFEKFLSFFIPHRCLVCREEVLSKNTLCSKCWPKLSFISQPFCEACGLPFDFEIEKNTLCGSCLEKRPSFDKARAAFHYGGASKDLILKFKHGDATELAPAFANWLSTAGRDFLAEAEVFVPIPLHWTRLLKRRYNQAALLSRHLSLIREKPHRPLGLKRIRATSSQGGLSKLQRRQNVEGVFYVPESESNYIKGKKVVLVDDVFTSGATISSAARALKNAGAESVFALTVARVTK